MRQLDSPYIFITAAASALLLIATTVAAQENPGDSPAAAGSTSAAVSDYDAGEASFAGAASGTAPAGSEPKVRVSLYGGAAAVADGPSGRQSLGDFESLEVGILPAGHLLLNLSQGMSGYGRTYVLQKPNMSNDGLQRVGTNERRYDTRLAVGYEVLHLLMDGDSNGDGPFVTPYLRGAFDVFSNQVVPQKYLHVGVGGQFGYRLKAVRFQGSFEWTHAIALGAKEVADLQAFGALTDALRWTAGPMFHAGGPMFVGLTYLGEVQYLAHSDRIINTFLAVIAADI